MHEMQHAITCTQRKADMRGGIKAASVARNDFRLATLPLPGLKQIFARSAGKNGGECFQPSTLSNSEEPRGEDRAEAANGRHHRNRFA